MFTENERANRVYRGFNPAFVRAARKKQLQKERERDREMERLRESAAKEKLEASRKEAELLAELASAQIALRDAMSQQEEAMRLYRLAADVEDPESAKEIIVKVALQHGLRYSDLIGPSRAQPIVTARHEAVVQVATRKPGYSLPMIGRAFKRDHTTILHVLRKAGIRTRPTGATNE